MEGDLAACRSPEKRPFWPPDQVGEPFADGSTNIGDGGTTNYAKVAADGALTLHGTAPVEKHIALDLSGLGKGATATRLHGYTNEAYATRSGEIRFKADWSAIAEDVNDPFTLPCLFQVKHFSNHHLLTATGVRK